MRKEDLKLTISGVLNKLPQQESRSKALIGLDGFIDKIQRPVRFQQASGSQYYSSLDSFGQRIKEAADQSAQIELQTKTIKLGGNAPIFAHSLGHLQVQSVCLGTFGLPQIHPVFQKIHANCQLISLGDAAETNALEFDDGKLILSELSSFSTLDWQQVKEQVNLEELVDYASQVQMIGLVDWCNLPHASDIWLGFYQDVVQAEVNQQPMFFFDLADPSKKSSEEVKQVIDIISGFSKYGQVTLGLNENETLKLSEFLGLSVTTKDDHQRLATQGRLLFKIMDIAQLLIHPIDGCFLINAQEEHYLPGRVVENPLVSTGGGDNFNAGFCFGQLNGFNGLESMALAMATSGSYVQHGISPDLEGLRDYLVNWQNEL